MNQEKIDRILNEIKPKICSVMGDDLVQATLYGSCARGDYNDESDVDIALFTKCGRDEGYKYLYELSGITEYVATNYNELLSFACFPMEEFMHMKDCYPLFININEEGRIFYER